MHIHVQIHTKQTRPGPQTSLHICGAIQFDANTKSQVDIHTDYHIQIDRYIYKPKELQI